MRRNQRHIQRFSSTIDISILSATQTRKGPRSDDTMANMVYPTTSNPSYIQVTTRHKLSIYGSTDGSSTNCVSRSCGDNNDNSSSDSVRWFLSSRNTTRRRRQRQQLTPLIQIDDASCLRRRNVTNHLDVHRLLLSTKEPVRCFEHQRQHIMTT